MKGRCFSVLFITRSWISHAARTAQKTSRIFCSNRFSGKARISFSRDENHSLVPGSFQCPSGTNTRNIDPAIIEPSFDGLSLISRFLRTGIRKILPASVLLDDFWLGRGNTGHAALLIITGVHHLIGAPGMGMLSWEWRGNLWSWSGGRPFWIVDRTPRRLRWWRRL